MSEHQPVESSAKLIAGCTLMSRITGLVRDMLLVHTFGLTWALDAFNYAFQIPNLFRRLFGEGALAAVFVPTFTHVLETEGKPSAWKILARTLALLTLILLGLIVLIEAIVLIIWLIDPGGPARQVILTLTAIMLPFMLSICVVALFSSILNCLGSFVAPALTPIVLNLVMIIGIVWVGPMVGGGDPEKQIFGVAFCVLVAGLLQFGLLIPVMRRRGVAFGWSLDTRNPHVKAIARKMIPIMFGQGVLLLGTFFDAQICALLTYVGDGPAEFSLMGFTLNYPLKEGALSAISVAQRLYQFPLGVLGISLAVAALPTFSRLATRKDWAGWTREVVRSARLALFIGLLTGGMMIVLARPIVRLLFEYGKFDAAATERSARVLVFYGFGMWAFCVQHIVLRAFYSLGDVRTPVKISCVIVPVNLTLSLVLIWVGAVGEAAFAVSSAVTGAMSVLAGVWLLRKSTGAKLITRSTRIAVVKMLFAAIVSVAVLYWLRQQWIAVLPLVIKWEILLRGVDTFGSLLLGSAVFLLLSSLMGLSEHRSIIRRNG